MDKKTETKEKLIAEIMKQCESDGEPVTFEEAEEMAEMELKNKENRRYEKAEKPTAKRKPPTHKEDLTKQSLINTLFKALADYGVCAEITNKERFIDFEYEGSHYTVMLTKHNAKKK